jgi:hypothetical protein
VSVYFICARELDLVKIGYAYNPLNRFNHLRTFSPVELTLEGAIPGGYGKEREFHKRFALARVRGEWFKLSPNLQAEIDASTRPEKYTANSVRAWLKRLAEADAELERQAIPPEVVEQIEQRRQAQLVAYAARQRMSYLERREHDGDIHFPFRAKADA